MASRPRPPVPSRSSDPALARLWHDLHGSRGEGGEEGPLCVDEGDVAASERRPLELRERGGEGQIDLVLLLLADRTRHRRGAVVHESLRARLGFDRSSAWNWASYDRASVGTLGGQRDSESLLNANHRC